MSRAALALGLLLVVTIGGCDKLTQTSQPKPKPRRAASTQGATVSNKSSLAQDQAPPVVPSSDHYAVPFAWEKGSDEPLAYARSFISDLLRDNQNYSQRVKPSAEGAPPPPPPRATVVACADSNVLSESWDATPENDEFIVRNLGNQVMTSLGSVHYGVEQLQTPVLLILAHTGCAAVMAALQSPSQLSEPIRKELSTLGVTPEGSKYRASAVLNDAIVANVHRQVRAALDRFGPRIVTGRLTVIGAVLDHQDELGKGAGRISIVNVNGNSEPKRLKAFVDAVQAQTAAAKPGLLPDAGIAEAAPGPDSSADAIVDPIALDLRSAFSALADKAHKQAPQPKHK
jgi:carbonic anhydrase